jgi:hypothetical protein
VLHIHSAVEECSFHKLLGILDKKTRQIKQKDPKFCKQGDSVLVSEQCESRTFDLGYNDAVYAQILSRNPYMHSWLFIHVDFVCMHVFLLIYVHVHMYVCMLSAC